MYYSSLKPKEPPVYIWSVYIIVRSSDFEFNWSWMRVTNRYLFALVGKRGLNFKNVDFANISNSPLRDGLDNQKLLINNIIAILLITEKSFNNTCEGAMKN